MSLSGKARGLFSRSSRAKSDFTPEELATAEAFLKKDGFAPSRSSSAEHVFEKANGAVSVVIAFDGTSMSSGHMYTNTKNGPNVFQTASTIRDYVRRQEIAATKNPLAKLLKKMLQP